jgi:hypothetical protein
MLELYATTDNNSVNTLAPALEVSVGGSPISSGSTQSFGNVDLSTSLAVTIVLENTGNPEDLNIGLVSLSGAQCVRFCS